MHKVGRSSLSSSADLNGIYSIFRKGLAGQPFSHSGWHFSAVNFGPVTQSNAKRKLGIKYRIEITSVFKCLVIPLSQSCH